MLLLFLSSKKEGEEKEEEKLGLEKKIFRSFREFNFVKYFLRLSFSFSLFLSFSFIFVILFIRLAGHDVSFVNAK